MANIDATRAQLRDAAADAGQLVAESWPPSYSWLDRLQRLIEAEQTGRGWTPASELSTSQREQIDSAAGQTVQLLAPIPAMFEASPLP